MAQDEFTRRTGRCLMYLLHNIGPRMNSNYNTREEIHKSRGPISFDGIYQNVYENRDVLIGRDVWLFIMGNYVGRDNSFDVKNNPHLKLEKYCDWRELLELKEGYQCKLGWHTWSHRNLCELSDREIRAELTLPEPDGLIPAIEKVIAYPYGNVNERVEAIAIEMGYREGWSVTQGNGSLFQLKRQYLNW